MNFRQACILLTLFTSASPFAAAQTPNKSSDTPAQVNGAQSPNSSSSDPAQTLGLSFPSDSNSTVLLTKDGKQYLIDVSTRTVKEIGLQQASGQNVQVAATASLFSKNCAVCHGADAKGIKSIGTPDFTDPAFQHAVSASEMETVIRKGKGAMPAWSGKLSDEQISGLITYIRTLGASSNRSGANNTSQIATTNVPNQQGKPPSNIYQPGDDVLVSLPTGRPTDRHGVYVNFAHRFPYQPAFTGPNEGATLFGLDNVAIPSFGVRYGVTDNLSVSVFRAPSLINRPIQLMAGYNILQERKGALFNLMVRVSIEGQDNFRKNYTENIEGIFSRSITRHAQFYLVPTFSFNDRRLIQPVSFASSSILDEPGMYAFSLGTGVAVDVRPTVALLAEVIPTFLNARALDIHRPVFAFGIQKKIWRHAFTLGLTTSPGTTVSQRAATAASFLNEPGADTLGHLFIGFDLTRQIK
jgi:mono/diheme cytochrome c family protein